MTAATTVAAKIGAYPPVRRIVFPFRDTTSTSRYFIEGDIVMSHFVAQLSGGFPAGEESFIRSVRAYADQIQDPVLKKRVAGFIGQEAVHGQQHRELNKRLVELGYPIAVFDSEKMIERFKRLEKVYGLRVHLASTAAAEHVTAVLAERVLSSKEIQAIPGEPEVWNLLNWHAMEELEHKSVAFDVYRATGGGEFARIATMGAMFATTPLLMVSLMGSLLADPYARRRPVTLVRQSWNLFRGPVFRGIPSEIAKYMRPGFHPDDVQTEDLLEQWQAELFGADGTLVDHLK